MGARTSACVNVLYYYLTRISGVFIVAASLPSLGTFSLMYTVLVPSTSPLLYYTARALHGIVFFMAIALSALADILPAHLRAPGVGMLMAGFWFGLYIAPTFAIFLNHLQVVALACTLQVLAIMLSVAVFPETLSPEAIELARARHEETNFDRTPFQSILWTLQRPFRELSIINRNGFFRLLSALAFFNGMVTAGDKTLLLYYVDSKLSFTATDIAKMFLLVGLSSVIAQGVVLKPLNECIGERWIVVSCFFASVISNVIYGLSRNKQTLYAGVCLGAITGMAFPTIAAIKANNVVRQHWLCIICTQIVAISHIHFYRMNRSKGVFKAHFTPFRHLQVLWVP